MAQNFPIYIGSNNQLNNHTMSFRKLFKLGLNVLGCSQTLDRLLRKQVRSLSFTNFIQLLRTFIPKNLLIVRFAVCSSTD